MDKETIVSTEMAKAGMDKLLAIINGEGGGPEECVTMIYLAMHAARPSQPPVTDVERELRDALLRIEKVSMRGDISLDGRVATIQTMARAAMQTGETK